MPAAKHDEGAAAFHPVADDLSRDVGIADVTAHARHPVDHGTLSIRIAEVEHLSRTKLKAQPLPVHLLQLGCRATPCLQESRLLEVLVQIPSPVFRKALPVADEILEVIEGNLLAREALQKNPVMFRGARLRTRHGDPLLMCQQACKAPLPSPENGFL